MTSLASHLYLSLFPESHEFQILATINISPEKCYYVAFVSATVASTNIQFEQK
jgi:hypothetical protein